MAGSDNSKPIKPTPPRVVDSSQRKPLQVMHISKKIEEDSVEKKIIENNDQIINKNNLDEKTSKSHIETPTKPIKKDIETTDEKIFKEEIIEKNWLDERSSYEMKPILEKNNDELSMNSFNERTVDEFDFDEDEFLAALNENQPIGNTGEIAKGKVIEIESDGVYVDIGGKAPGFMPKKECGLGVITNIKEQFPKGLEVEVLVTREQNADGMVTISRRALALRQSWDKVKLLEKEGAVVQVKVNGFNRGGVTCDLEGLRGFIPRSQLENGEQHETLVGKNIGVTFLEVNPDNRKLVLSEKKAAIAKRLAQLSVGQLIEGKVASIKPYGFFIDLGGISGLLHQSSITNGSIRSLYEIFKKGEVIKALVCELDPRRGRIGLSTALLENQPGEIIENKSNVMSEAEERSKKAQIDLEKSIKSTSE